MGEETIYKQMNEIVLKELKIKRGEREKYIIIYMSEQGGRLKR